MWDEITIAAAVWFDRRTYLFEGFLDRSLSGTEFDPENNREETRYELFG